MELERCLGVHVDYTVPAWEERLDPCGDTHGSGVQTQRINWEVIRPS